MRRSGFTLLEVLVSVAILATVSATVALVMGVGSESWRTAARMAETGHDGEAVLEQIALALRSACYPSDGELSYDYGFQIEDGGEGATARDIVYWTKIGNALVGEDVPWAGSPHRVRLYVDNSGPDGPGLYVAAWQLVGQPEDFDEEEDPVPVLLSDMVTGLDVRMQDPEKAVEIGEPYEWTDEWEASNRIPRRVFITLALQPNEKGGEPQELVRSTDIPLAELSWTPAAVGSDSRKRDNGDDNSGRSPDDAARGGAVGDAAAVAPPSGVRGGFRRGGGVSSGGGVPGGGVAPPSRGGGVSSGGTGRGGSVRIGSAGFSGN